MHTVAQRTRPLLPGAPVLPRRAAPVRPHVGAARRGDLDLATVSDGAGLAALEPEWSALFAAAGRPHQVFQTHEWLALWAQLYLDRACRLAIVTGRLDGRLVLVWPLVIRRVACVRVALPMGEPLSQYADAILAADLDPAAQDAAFDYVARLPVDLVAFRRVREDAAITPLLQRRLGAGAETQAAPVVDLVGVADAASFERRFGGKVRASRRRRRKRIEEQGPVSFAHAGPSSEAEALVGTALAFKRDWARQAGVVSPALRDPRFERFFQLAARPEGGVPSLRVSALRCGDDVLGVEISVACKGHLFGHVLAPRPGDPQLGLGGVLAEATILNALAQRFEAVDLLAPADAYKLAWTSKTVGVADHAVAVTLRGWLYDRLWLRSGRARAKRLARRLRPLIARG